LPSLSEYVGGRYGKTQRELRGECLIGLTAYAVGTEESRH
jgi:hypothetical protein